MTWIFASLILNIQETLTPVKLKPFVWLLIVNQDCTSLTVFGLRPSLKDMVVSHLIKQPSVKYTILFNILVKYSVPFLFATDFYWFWLSVIILCYVRHWDYHSFQRNSWSHYTIQRDPQRDCFIHGWACYYKPDPSPGLTFLLNMACRFCLR